MELQVKAEKPAKKSQQSKPDAGPDQDVLAFLEIPSHIRWFLLVRLLGCYGEIHCLEDGSDFFFQHVNLTSLVPHGAFFQVLSFAVDL